MTANIFNPTDYESIVNRIQTLAPEQQRKWGTMTLPEMLEHCAGQLKLALGKISGAKREGPAAYRVGFIRWIVLYPLPWPKGLPTPTVMKINTGNVIVQHCDTEKTELLHLLQLVYQTDQPLHAHPYFGLLSRKDWGRAIWKHLNHHLRQFGV
jgi:Protein of unknown function (DUF1569)